MGRIPTPPNPVKLFFLNPDFYDLTIAIGTLVVGGLEIYKQFKDGNADAAWFLVGGSIFVLVLLTLKFLVQWNKRKKDSSPSELEGCLHTLHAILTQMGGGSKSCQLRITLHVPIEDGQRLEQVTEYVGDERKGNGRKGKSAGRKFPAQSGIIGLAYRMRAPYVAARLNDDYDAYVKELIEKWHYTEHDAKVLDPSTKSWVAVPLIENNSNNPEVEAVIYLDSTDKEFFTPERVTVIQYAAVGVAAYAKRRYTNVD